MECRDRRARPPGPRPSLAVIVPRPARRDDEVARLHGRAFAVDRGVGAAPFRRRNARRRLRVAVRAAPLPGRIGCGPAYSDRVDARPARAAPGSRGIEHPPHRLGSALIRLRQRASGKGHAKCVSSANGPPHGVLGCATGSGAAGEDRRVVVLPFGGEDERSSGYCGHGVLHGRCAGGYCKDHCGSTPSYRQCVPMNPTASLPDWNMRLRNSRITPRAGMVDLAIA